MERDIQGEERLSVDSQQATLLGSLFQLPAYIGVSAICSTEAQITLHIACQLGSAACPHCQQPSERVHGRYGRVVADMPCGGRKVVLALTVRKFVCGAPQCSQKIFTERLPDFVQSCARMTNRLSETFQTLGFATCGEVGERLAPKLGMGASGPTILRRMRTRTCPAPSSVRIVGIDDWCWKKGMTYGTLLVDLESRKPIELLPDRTVETSEAWLRSHPEIEIVSRDRGGDYAAAAKRGAPQARQIADRFHLLKNLRDAVRQLLDRHHTHLPKVEKSGTDAIPARARGKEALKQPNPRLSLETSGEKRYRTIPPSPYQRPLTTSYKTFQKHVQREKRLARYEEVRALSKQGGSIRQIARHLKINRITVRRFLSAEEYPEIHRAGHRTKWGLLDPYKPHILERWKQGCRNSVQLYDEITSQGYSGSSSLLRQFLAEMRKKHREAGDVEVLRLNGSGQQVEIPADHPAPPQILRRMSSGQASWLFVSQVVHLDEKQKKSIDQIRTGHADLDAAYQLTQMFVAALAERREQALDTRLTQAEQSPLPELKRFARGIRRDYEAVAAACSLEWSNGQVEAQVNCLKLQKRIVFGRANLDLLRLRVLCRV